MQATQIHEMARRLRDAHGDKAVAEAAQKAVSFEQHGDKAQAEAWRRIEAALKRVQGPHES